MHGAPAGGAGDDEAVVALRHEPLGQRRRSFEVDAAVVVEGGDHGGDQGSEAPHQVASSLAVSGSVARSMPSVASRFSCSSNHTEWYESIVGLVNQSRSPPCTLASAPDRRGP